MRIGMLTWGSYGDVRPLLALAEGLQAAGHEVTLAICAVDGTRYAARAGVGQAVRLLTIPSPIASAEQGQALAHTVYTARDPLRQIDAVMRQAFEPAEAAMMETARTLASASDLLIGHYFVHPLHTAALEADVPYVSVLLSHAGIPSAHNHPKGSLGLGKLGHRLLWWLTRKLLQRALAPYPNRWRARLGLPQLQDVLTQSWITDPLTLLAVSPVLCQPRADWPRSVHACGFFDALHVEGALAPELDAFLAGGEAPVYLTLGSWMPKDTVQQRATLALLTDAASRAGCRAIIQADAALACGFASTERILYVAKAAAPADLPALQRGGAPRRRRHHPGRHPGGQAVDCGRAPE